MKPIKGHCYYFGKFAPPTKYHFNTAMMLETRMGITNVIVVIGNDESDIISIEDKFAMWKMFIDSEPTIKIKLQKTDGQSSLKYVLSKIEESPETQCFIAVDSKNAKSESFNRSISRLPNVHLQLISSQFNDKSKELVDALQSGNMLDIADYMPINVTKEQIKDLKNKFQKNIEDEPVEEKSKDIKEKFIQEFDTLITKI